MAQYQSGPSAPIEDYDTFDLERIRNAISGDPSSLRDAGAAFDKVRGKLADAQQSVRDQADKLQTALRGSSGEQFQRYCDSLLANSERVTNALRDGRYQQQLSDAGAEGEQARSEIAGLISLSLKARVMGSVLQAASGTAPVLSKAANTFTDAADRSLGKARNQLEAMAEQFQQTGSALVPVESESDSGNTNTASTSAGTALRTAGAPGATPTDSSDPAQQQQSGAPNKNAAEASPGSTTSNRETEQPPGTSPDRGAEQQQAPEQQRADQQQKDQQPGGQQQGPLQQQNGPQQNGDQPPNEEKQQEDLEQQRQEQEQLAADSRDEAKRKGQEAVEHLANGQGGADQAGLGGGSSEGGATEQDAGPTGQAAQQADQDAMTGSTETLQESTAATPDAAGEQTGTDTAAGGPAVVPRGAGNTAATTDRPAAAKEGRSREPGPDAQAARDAAHDVSAAGQQAGQQALQSLDASNGPDTTSNGPGGAGSTEPATTSSDPATEGNADPRAVNSAAQEAATAAHQAGQNAMRGFDEGQSVSPDEVRDTVDQVANKSQSAGEHKLDQLGEPTVNEGGAGSSPGEVADAVRSTGKDQLDSLSNGGDQLNPDEAREVVNNAVDAGRSAADQAAPAPAQPGGGLADFLKPGGSPAAPSAAPAGDTGTSLATTGTAGTPPPTPSAGTAGLGNGAAPPTGQPTVGGPTGGGGSAPSPAQGGGGGGTPMMPPMGGMGGMGGGGGGGGGDSRERQTWLAAEDGTWHDGDTPGPNVLGKDAKS